MDEDMFDGLKARDSRVVCIGGGVCVWWGDGDGCSCGSSNIWIWLYVFELLERLGRIEEFGSIKLCLRSVQVAKCVEEGNLP